MSTYRTPIEFRAELLSAVAFHRVKALHALECQAEALGEVPFGQELIAFVSRGVPYYSLEDPHYMVWVDQAEHYWQKVNQVTCPA